MEREILEILLDCGSMDTSVLMDIDSDIIEEAVRELKDEGIELNFPNLYYECARIALHRVGLTEDDAEIDCNYACAAIYLCGKDKAKELERTGFTVYY
ncbi:hypothetical protein DRN97_02335 [Methanosarcinales archaeon]|nr:MAG: hypothetical protein DRN97_02335 [Methanosarcinales archaeon]